MPFPANPIRQSKTFTLTAQGGSLALTFDSPVAAGSAIVVIGTSIGATDQAALMGTPSGGATWSAATNTRITANFSPNVGAALGINASAGSPTITVPFTVNGTTVSGGSPTTYRFSGCLLEIEGVPTTDVLDSGASPRTGTASGTASTATSASGTLSQADSLLIACGGGWGGIWGTPSGWTSRLTQQNGTFIGSSVATLKVAATTSVTPSFPHEADNATSAILLVLKGSATASFKYVFEFPASGGDSLPSSEGSIEALVWRNVEPFSAGRTPEYYSGLTADSGTKPGDTTTRLLQITSGLPVGVVLGDTIRGVFRKSGGTTNGSVAVINGTVASA